MCISRLKWRGSNSDKDKYLTGENLWQDQNLYETTFVGGKEGKYLDSMIKYTQNLKWNL